MKYFTVQIEEKGPKLYVKNPAEEDWLFSEADEGDLLIIKCIEISQERIDKLPEFTGF